MVREASRYDLVFGLGPRGDPDHEAVIRFSGKAPRRRTHSHHGIEALQLRGSSPPRASYRLSRKKEAGR